MALERGHFGDSNELQFISVVLKIAIILAKTFIKMAKKHGDFSGFFQYFVICAVISQARNLCFTALERGHFDDSNKPHYRFVALKMAIC